MEDYGVMVISPMSWLIVFDQSPVLLLLDSGNLLGVVYVRSWRKKLGINTKDEV